MLVVLVTLVVMMLVLDNRVLQVIQACVLEPLPSGLQWWTLYMYKH
jgi:hypothetical protein